MSLEIVRITSYPGKKDKLLKFLMELMPSEKITKTWEPFAGTLSMSVNLLKGFEPIEMYATEKDLGMYSLLHAIQENPVELYESMEELEYCKESYDWATKLRNSGYQGADELQIAKAKYILCNMSINGIDQDGKYRDIDLNTENDLKKYCYAKQVRERFRRQVFENIMRGHKSLQGIKLENADMMDKFMLRAYDKEMFIFADVPYTDKDLYAVKTDLDWHKNFIQTIIMLQKQGNLNAKIMICNYCKKDLRHDVYCELLKYGFKLVKVTEVVKPTVIRRNTKKKNKETEYVFINYEPIGTIARNRIKTRKDVFGE